MPPSFSLIPKHFSSSWFSLSEESLHCCLFQVFGCDRYFINFFSFREWWWEIHNSWNDCFKARLFKWKKRHKEDIERAKATRKLCGYSDFIWWFSLVSSLLDLGVKATLTFFDLPWSKRKKEICISEYFNDKIKIPWSQNGTLPATAFSFLQTLAKILSWSDHDEQKLATTRKKISDAYCTTFNFLWMKKKLF